MEQKNSYRSETLLMALNVGLLGAAFTMAKTGRDALFFQGQGLFQLPMVYIAIGTFAVPAALVVVKCMKVWGAAATRIGFLVFAASALILFVPFLEPGNYPVLISLFVSVPTLFGVLFASLWLLASSIFESAPRGLTARSFSRIGASSLAGGMAGGFVSKGLVPYLEPRWFVFIAALLILAVVGFVVRTHRQASARGASGKKPESPDQVNFSRVFSKKYARSLLFISTTGALAGLFIDFQFYAAASGAKMGSQGNANFFANFYIMLNLSSLILQLFAAPKIQDRVGLRGGLLILPLGLLGGATFVTVAATALSRSVLRVTEGGLKASIHRSIWEQAFIPVSSEERSFVKVYVDGIGARAGEGIAAMWIFTWLATVDVSDPSMVSTQWMAWVVLVAVVLWLWLTHDLRHRLAEEPAVVAQPIASVPPDQKECSYRFPDQCPCTTEWGKGIK